MGALEQETSNETVPLSLPQPPPPPPLTENLNTNNNTNSNKSLTHSDQTSVATVLIHNNNKNVASETASQTNGKKTKRRRTKSTKSTKSVRDEEAVARQGRIRSIWRNLFVFSFSFFGVFAASNGCNLLHSSVNGSLGLDTLVTISISFCIACLFLPALLAKYCGFKWPLVVSELCMCLYVGANFYPRVYTLLPAGALFGCATSVLWTYQGSLVSHLATEYAVITKGKLDSILIKFLGIFYIIYQSSNYKISF
jgi:hypothetical protein